MPPSLPPRFTDVTQTLGHGLSGTNLERAGDHNQRVTLQAIRVHGPTTRAHLVDVTGLTAPAIANITKRLLTEQLVIEVGRNRGGRGQPAMRLAINPGGCLSIGINIDRDHITAVVLDLMGTVRARTTRPIDLSDPTLVARLVQGDVRTLLADPSVHGVRMAGIGVAVPDDLARLSLPHWPSSRYDAWATVDIPSFFAEFRPLPVFVENDAAAAALGELQFGHGLHHPSFFYVLISGGLGGGLVIEGNYCRGANGRSGEIGYLPIAARHAPARTLQDIVSLGGLYEWLQADGCNVAHPEQILRFGDRGQAVIDRWLNTAAELLVEPMVNINCLINPHAVYLGGQLPGSLVDQLASRLNQRLNAIAGTIPAIAPVQRAAMAADAPAIGAALLPFSHQLLPLHAAMVKSHGT